MRSQEREGLLATLKARFEANPQRHPGASWLDVERRLAGKPGALEALAAMQESGGEPDVVELDGGAGAIIFVDCSSESPAGRRSLCYDGAAFNARKQAKPQGSAADMAAAMGIELLTEAQYRALQTVGEFDLKTSSWVATPAQVREQGGALFCDRRYGQVFVYHNGAQSYYGARGFRGALLI